MADLQKSFKVKKVMQGKCQHVEELELVVPPPAGTVCLHAQRDGYIVIPRVTTQRWSSRRAHKQNQPVKVNVTDVLSRLRS